jgi:hypothetical protein
MQCGAVCDATFINITFTVLGHRFGSFDEQGKPFCEGSGLIRGEVK